jgi:hypothetical protein
MTAPTALDLALAIRDLDDRQNRSAATANLAQHARHLADQVLAAAGWTADDQRDWHPDVPVRAGHDQSGYDPHDVDADDWARMRVAAAAAGGAEWVGWPNSVRRVAQVTIAADQHGWWVTDGVTYWTPATMDEAALSPADYARKVAASIGGVYAAPHAACVPVQCQTCDNSMSGLVDRPLPTRCYTCVHGPVTPMVWTWRGPSAAELAARADTALLATEPAAAAA